MGRQRENTKEKGMGKRRRGNETGKTEEEEEQMGVRACLRACLRPPASAQPVRDNEICIIYAPPLQLPAVSRKKIKSNKRWRNCEL